MESPGFSKFRALMDMWDEFLLEQENEANLKHFIDSHGLVLFFKKGSEYFGAGEDSRVIFARLKHPDGESSPGWEDEASFSAVNLTKMAHGELSQNIFDKGDLKQIHIVDRDEVIEKLKDAATQDGKKLNGLRIVRVGFTPPHDRDQAPNFVRTDEK